MSGTKRQYATFILIGALIGVIVTASLPALAGGSDSDRRATIARRVARLERKVTRLSQRLNAVSGRVGTVEGRTSQLSTSGGYTGQIDSDQINIPFLCSGDPAVWGLFSFSGLDC
jgi:hypothetical protein